MQLGKSITTYNDQLERISALELYRLISQSKQKLKPLIEQLRTLQTIDANQYRKQKTQLPYFTTASFSPPFRKKENFAATQFFVLDIDHLQKNEINMQLLKEKLATDPQVHMLFVSPGNDGLKVLFRLKQKCFDAGKYSLLYKQFARNFGLKYGIENSIDTRTCDVSRACFLSYDPQAFFNPKSEVVDWENAMDLNDFQEIKQVEKEIKLFEQQLPETIPAKHPLETDLLQEIKQKLNPNFRTRKQKNIYVPEQLNEILETVTNQLHEKGVTVDEVTNIHYGKKFRVSVKQTWAEVNLFYGKKGFSVVKTPKRGSNAELANIAHQIISELFF